MTKDEMLAKLLETYGLALLSKGLTPERLPKILDKAQYMLASLLANDLAVAV